MEAQLKTIPQERMAPAWLLDRYPARALVVGGIGYIALIICSFVGADALYHGPLAYLAGIVLWVGASLGCMALLMPNHLSAGKWGLIIRRVLEAGAGQFPLMWVLSIPIVLGMHRLFPWTEPRFSQLSWDAQKINIHK